MSAFTEYRRAASMASTATTASATIKHGVRKTSSPDCRRILFTGGLANLVPDWLLERLRQPLLGFDVNRGAQLTTTGRPLRLFVHGFTGLCPVILVKAYARQPKIIIRRVCQRGRGSQRQCASQAGHADHREPPAKRLENSLPAASSWSLNPRSCCNRARELFPP